MCAPKHASFINQTFPVVKTGCGWQGREQMCGAPEVHGDSWPQAGGTVHRVLLRQGEMSFQIHSITMAGVPSAGGDATPHGVMPQIGPRPKLAIGSFPGSLVME